MNNPYTHDKNNREYFFAVPHVNEDYTKLDIRPSMEDIMCELQLDAIGTWELLNFNIDQKKWSEDRLNLEPYWRPFQPKEGILNDRDSILLYGLPGDKPTSPTGLSQVKKKLGYKPNESKFNVPTDAAKLLTCCQELFDYFDPLGRTFLVRLNAGGFYPRHRDHLLLTRDTVRLIVFLDNSQDNLEWEVNGTVKTFLPNSVYYVDTRKMHRLSSWGHDSTMVVLNVNKTWKNILKILSRLKHS